MDGYHTMTLTVTKNYILPGLKFLGTYTTITLSDQGTLNGTIGKGNSNIGSFEALDRVLTSYVKSQATAKTQDGSSYTAKIEVHQVLAAQ